MDADTEPIVADVLAELRAADIRRIQNGDLTAGEAAVLTSINDCAVLRHDGQWVASVNYTAELLRDAGMAFVETNPDGFDYLMPTEEGSAALRGFQTPGDALAEAEARRAAVEPKLLAYEAERAAAAIRVPRPPVRLVLLAIACAVGVAAGIALLVVR